MGNKSTKLSESLPPLSVAHVTFEETGDGETRFSTEYCGEPICVCVPSPSVSRSLLLACATDDVVLLSTVVKLSRHTLSPLGASEDGDSCLLSVRDTVEVNVVDSVAGERYVDCLPALYIATLCVARECINALLLAGAHPRDMIDVLGRSAPPSAALTVAELPPAFLAVEYALRKMSDEDSLSGRAPSKHLHSLEVASVRRVVATDSLRQLHRSIGIGDDRCAIPILLGRCAVLPCSFVSYYTALSKGMLPSVGDLPLCACGATSTTMLGPIPQSSEGTNGTPNVHSLAYCATTLGLVVRVPGTLDELLESDDSCTDDSEEEEEEEEEEATESQWCQSGALHFLGYNIAAWYSDVLDDYQVCRDFSEGGGPEFRRIVLLALFLSIVTESAPTSARAGCDGNAVVRLEPRQAASAAVVTLCAYELGRVVNCLSERVPVESLLEDVVALRKFVSPGFQLSVIDAVGVYVLRFIVHSIACHNVPCIVIFRDHLLSCFGKVEAPPYHVEYWHSWLSGAADHHRTLNDCCLPPSDLLQKLPHERLCPLVLNALYVGADEQLTSASRKGAADSLDEASRLLLFYLLGGTVGVEADSFDVVGSLHSTWGHPIPRHPIVLVSGGGAGSARAKVMPNLPTALLNKVCAAIIGGNVAEVHVDFCKSLLVELLFVAGGASSTIVSDWKALVEMKPEVALDDVVAFFAAKSLDDYGADGDAADETSECETLCNAFLEGCKSFLPLSVGGVMTFDKAASLAATLPSSTPTATKLRLYGLYKQATCGDCATAKPSVLNAAASAKWTAWSNLCHLAKDAAQERYIQLVREQIGGFH